MEAAAGASAAARNGVSMVPPPMSSSSSAQASRKAWRVVTEQSVRNSGNEEVERSKLGPSDERLIYEVRQGREPVDVDFCSITNDGDLDIDILQQRLLTVTKQREELQHMEIDLHAQVIVRSEIVRMQNTFEAQIKEHANANLKLQEQLHETEKKMHELERKIDEKERELQAIRLDNQAAWAKEDLLREQSKELQSYRRERDNSEAERAQHIKQMHDLQEHIQEKERQCMELQEQHRNAQETINFKDEQIREAQTWITRAQEMDALQLTTNHTLQAELRERTEQYNQLWLGCQRQFGEMERLHLHIQQLQLELTDAREKSASHSDGSHVSQTNSNDASRLGHINGSQIDANGSNSASGNSDSIQNGNSKTSGGNTLTQTDHVQSVTFAPSSLFGMPPTYLPTGQMTALHPFQLHQGVPHPSQVTQSHFHSVPAMSLIQSWQSQHAVPDGQNAPTENQFPQQTEGDFLRTNSNYDYEASANGQVLRENYLDTKASLGLDADSAVPSLNREGQVFNSLDESHGNVQSQQSLQQISSQFHEALRLDPLGHSNETKEKKANTVTDPGVDNKNTIIEQSSVAVNTSSSEAPVRALNISEITIHVPASAALTNTFVSTGQKSSTIAGKPVESCLLDERALLACIARTIGSGGRTRISSTLPNRLGKMLAPLHWHDYKKKYGKLDEFVANHPDLFLIEGDYIQLRVGAQETIAATSAVAKVNAAKAATPPSYTSSLPSVALTPMAQPHRMKNADKTSFNDSNVKILSKQSDYGNGTNAHGRPGVVGKQNSRTIGTASNPRR